ncbi:MAG: histidine kinase [Lachnospiraceae bacterium]|nr:histidine kinase [Lachnospiraceae bacterium]
MLRLEDEQLHTLLGILCGVTLLLAVLFGVTDKSRQLINGHISKMSTISEGWVVTYETSDEDKIKARGEWLSEEKTQTISEVVNLPNDFKSVPGKVVTLTNVLPDMTEDDIYLVVKTGKGHVKISVNKEMIYDDSAEYYVFPYHVIKLDSKYNKGDISVYVKNNGGGASAEAVKIGTFTELIGEAINENGIFVVFALFLFVSGIFLIINCLLIKSAFNRKKLLVYSGLETLSAGAMFLLQSKLFHTILNWEMFAYFLQCSMVVIAAVLHLLVQRSLILRKKFLTVVDFGIIFYCIVYVSVMVLKWFRLVTFDKAYLIELILFAVGVIIYTLLMGSASYDYKQKEGRPLFVANLVLIVSAVIELLLYLSKYGHGINGKPIIVGCTIYFVVMWMYGLKRAHYVEKVKESAGDDMAIKEQVIERINPNLLFASFQTLQNLIKKGSNLSVKMIYYISVYVRDNMLSLTEQGEMIPFGDELEHMLAYLQLQKIRNRSFEFAIECKHKDFYVPRNTIEPMVENAVKYGIGGNNNTGNVVVRVYEREEGYAIQVIDDGIGFDAGKLKNTSATSLRNLFEILESKCEAKTEIISKEGKGTVITIIIPALENELATEEIEDFDDEL